MFLGLTRKIFCFTNGWHGWLWVHLEDVTRFLNHNSFGENTWWAEHCNLDAPESINIFTSFPPLFKDLVWGVINSIDLFLGAGYRENFLFTFIKVKLIHWMLLWRFPVLWLPFMCGFFLFRFSWVTKPRTFCERSVTSSVDQFETGAAEGSF